MPNHVVRSNFNWYNRLRNLHVCATGLGGVVERMNSLMEKKKADIKQGKSPSQLITERIAELGDWRGETLAQVRKLIKEADPKITEEWKWRGVPVWYDNGMVCTGESYKDHIKLTFHKGAAIKDPKGVFNAGLDGNARRAIDLYEGDKINESAFKEIIRAAVTLNSKGKK